MACHRAWRSKKAQRYAAIWKLPMHRKRSSSPGARRDTYGGESRKAGLLPVNASTLRQRMAAMVRSAPLSAAVSQGTANVAGKRMTRSLCPVCELKYSAEVR